MDNAQLVLDADRFRSARDLPSSPIGDLRSDLIAHRRRIASALNYLDSADTVADITLVAAEDERSLPFTATRC